MRARLVSLCGHPTIHLTKTMTLVGRQECCDVRIISSRISRCHCCLVIENSEVIVRDLNSTNGTHVNGRAVASSPLVHGDLLTIGHLKYRVAVEGSPGDRPGVGPGDASPEGSAEDHPTALEIELHFRVASPAQRTPAQNEVLDLVYRHCKSAGLLLAMPPQSAVAMMDLPTEETARPARVTPLELIEAIPIFTSLTEDEKRALAEATSVREFRKGEVIVRQGELRGEGPTFEDEEFLRLLFEK